MEPSNPNFEILSDYEEEMLESQAVREVLDHLAVGLLSKLDVHVLCSFVQCGEEPIEQEKLRMSLARKVWDQVLQLSTLSGVGRAFLPWFHRKTQQYLTSAVAGKRINEVWVHNFLLRVWNDMKQAKENGSEFPKWYKPVNPFDIAEIQAPKRRQQHQQPPSVAKAKAPSKTPRPRFRKELPQGVGWPESVMQESMPAVQNPTRLEVCTSRAL
jgi:hypothetical protein